MNTVYILLLFFVSLAQSSAFRRDEEGLHEEDMFDEETIEKAIQVLDKLGEHYKSNNVLDADWQQNLMIYCENIKLYDPKLEKLFCGVGNHLSVFGWLECNACKTVFLTVSSMNDDIESGVVKGIKKTMDIVCSKLNWIYPIKQFCDKFQLMGDVGLQSIIQTIEHDNAIVSSDICEALNVC